jgi:hypothetical protein
MFSHSPLHFPYFECICALQNRGWLFPRLYDVVSSAVSDGADEACDQMPKADLCFLQLGCYGTKSDYTWSLQHLDISLLT